MKSENCSRTDLSTSEYLECVPEIMGDVLTTVSLVMALAVSVAILFVGVRMVKRVINAAGESAS